MAKPWAELGERVGLEVVKDEEVEQDQEEVEKIIQKGKETKRKLAMGKHVMISCRIGRTVYSTVQYICKQILN